MISEYHFLSFYSQTHEVLTIPLLLSLLVEARNGRGNDRKVEET